MYDERKNYENEKMGNEIIRIYKKNGLKKGNGDKILLSELEKIMKKINEYNYNCERNEFLFKNNLKNMLKEYDIKILENEIINEIINDLNKKEFKIPKCKVERELAKYIRKIYKEVKLIYSTSYVFLITDKFKRIEEIEKIKMERNGLVKCIDKYNEIKCIFIFSFLFDNYICDFLDLVNFYTPENINNKFMLFNTMI